MNTYGNTCPNCCGDMNGAVVCQFCGSKTEAQALAPSTAQPAEMSDATAMSPGIEIQTGADIALPETANI